MLLFQLGLVECVTRIDLTGSPLNPPHKLIYAARQFESLPAPNQTSRVSITEPFTIKMSCDSSVSQTNCQLARNSISNIGKKISKVLEIQKPINLNFTFRPFCPLYEKSCSQSKFLGKARPASYIIAKVGGQYVSYPQALIKNMITDQKLPLSTYDIVAEFNSDFNWWFPSKGGSPSSQQYDFEYVVAHEITHGLGFSSGFIYPYDIDSSIAPPNFLSPLFYLENDNAVTVSLTQPISAFDYYTVGSTGAWKDFGLAFQNVKMKPVRTIDMFFYNLKSDPAAYNAGKLAYQAITSNDGTLKLGKSGELFSPPKYLAGSSGSHFSLSYQFTSDFLMTYQVGPGTRLDKMNLGSDQVYGPQTIDALTTIGWAPYDSTLKSIQIATDFGATIPNSALSYKWSVLLLFALL